MRAGRRAFTLLVLASLAPLTLLANGLCEHSAAGPSSPLNPPFVRLVLNIPRAGQHRIELHDLSGERVRALRDTELPAGRLALRWDGRDDHGEALPSGRYWVRLDDRLVGSAGLVR